MADTKQTNQKASLLHYLIKLLESRMPELLTFAEDLPQTGQAAKRTFTFDGDPMESVFRSAHGGHYCAQHIPSYLSAVVHLAAGVVTTD